MLLFSCRIVKMAWLGRWILVVFLCRHAALAMNFNYELFENFVVCERVFKEELQLREMILGLREELVKKRQLLADSEGKMNKVEASALSHFADHLKDNSNSSSKLRGEFARMTKNFSDQKSFTGALRALLMMRETYRIETKDLTKGVMNLYSPASQTWKTFKADHGLSTHDLVDLAGTAIMDGWIDDAVDITKVGMSMLEESGDLHNTSIPEHLKEHLQQLPKMKSILPKIQNDMLEKRKALVGQDFKILPYVIDNNLEKAKEQPKYLNDIIKNAIREQEIAHFGTDSKEYFFRAACRRKRIGNKVIKQEKFMKCKYLHHNNPFLRLGPFKMELLLKEPVRMIFHDIFSEEEMRWMKEYSLPRLSTARGKSANNLKVKKNTADPKIRRIVHKTVQVWLIDKVWDKQVDYEEVAEGEWEQKDFVGDLQAGKVVMPVMWKLARKIEIATRMEVRARFASTHFQVTNYGLGGLCETHVDPHGYLDGAYLDFEQKDLVSMGDMIATFMGWLEDVPAGGETAYDLGEYAQLVTPRRGSAAFWIDLEKAGKREFRSSHGGCPIAIGSKWILNKWMYYFDQFRNFPCGLRKRDQYQPFTGVYT